MLSIGIIFFLLGFLEGGYKVLTAIGIGTVMGAAFIFLFGLFFVTSEEMLEKIYNNHNKMDHIVKKESAIEDAP